MGARGQPDCFERHEGRKKGSLRSVIPLSLFSFRWNIANNDGGYYRARLSCVETTDGHLTASAKSTNQESAHPPW
jgi:hypothetical protein